MKKKVTVVIVALALVIGGLYYWNWQSLHKQSVMAVPTNPDSSSAVQEESSENMDRINILLLGSDARGDETGRTDSIMLVSADLKTHEVNVVSVPRDTRVNIPGVGLTKITHANVVGAAKGGEAAGTMTTIQAVSDLLGVTIHDYAMVDFAGFEKIVDSLGGLEVNLPVAVNDDGQKLHLAAGENHLTGDEALRLARARYGLPGGDFDRQRAQYMILEAAAEKAVSLENIAKIPELSKITQEDLLDTSLSNSEILALALEFKGITGENVKYYQLPGKGIRAHDPLVGAELYYYETNPMGVKEIMAEVLG